MWMRGGEVLFQLYALPGHAEVPTIFLVRPKGSVDQRGILSHNGRRLSLRQEHVRTLAPGDWLVFRRRAGSAPEIFQLEHEQSGLISELRQGREGHERIFLPAHGLGTLVNLLAAGLDNYLGTVKETQRYNEKHNLFGWDPKPFELLRQRSIWLALDANLQDASNRLLSDVIHAKLRNYPIGWSAETTRGLAFREPPRAGMTVLDLASGEVLAMATYPQRQHADEHLDRLRSFLARDTEPSSDRRLKLLAQRALERAEARRGIWLENHNLDKHQIGSAIKPLFATALSLAWPNRQVSVNAPDEVQIDPLTLEIECRGDQLEGAPLPGPLLGLPIAHFTDRGHDHVGFRRYLSHSCNTFQFALGELALAMMEGYDGTCDALGDQLAQSGMPDEFTPQSVARMAPLTRLAWLGGAKPRAINLGPVSQHGRQWWNPLMGELDAYLNQTGCAPDYSSSLASVSPEKPNFEVMGLASCYPHYSSFLKGASTNRWSNVDLSVAFARMISGRRIEGSLLRSDPPSPDAPDAVEPPFDVHDCSVSLACDSPSRYEQVRTEVLAGLSLSLSVGTTSGMRSAIRAALTQLEEKTGRRWGAYAKTGSADRKLDLVVSSDRSARAARTGRWTSQVTNLTLALLQCAPEETTPASRSLPFACQMPPRLGEAEGFIIHTWMDGVDDFDEGADLTKVFQEAALARPFFERLAEFREVSR
jgi:hypothetical protein